MKTWRVMIAPDSFKGSLSALQAARAMADGLQKAVAGMGGLPIELQTTIIPMADGGEGTVEAIIEAVGGGRIVEVPVRDPLGRPITSFFGMLPDGTAVLEMAAASGLNLVARGELNPLLTTTYGTGQLIAAALDARCQRIIIGIGGSATNDGGVGMAQALGVRFLDESGQEVGFGGRELQKIQRIDLAGVHSRLAGTPVVVASDVKNVLCGPEGAAAVYGPQKGATPEMVELLDAGLAHLSRIIHRDTGADFAMTPGAGAAGGLGAGLMAFAGGRLQSGIDIVMELARVDEKMADTDTVFTGEGATDFQTMFGKVPFGVAGVARKYGKPVFCVSGSLGKGHEQLLDNGITAMFSIVNRPMPLDEAIGRAAELLSRTVEQVARVYLQAGNGPTD